MIFEITEKRVRVMGLAISAAENDLTKITETVTIWSTRYDLVSNLSKYSNQFIGHKEQALFLYKGFTNSKNI